MKKKEEKKKKENEKQTKTKSVPKREKRSLEQKER